MIGASNAGVFGAGAITLGNGAGGNATLETTNSFTYANPISTVAGSTGLLTILTPNGNGNPVFSGGITLASALTLEYGSIGTYTVSTGNITGTGNLTTKIDSTGAIAISSPVVNNVGTITNTGAGTGATTISGLVGTTSRPQCDRPERK